MDSRTSTTCFQGYHLLRILWKKEPRSVELLEEAKG